VVIIPTCLMAFKTWASWAPYFIFDFTRELIIHWFFYSIWTQSSNHKVDNQQVANEIFYIITSVHGKLKRI
jgi:hypothetical protein